MIGLRTGIKRGPRIGLAVGASGDELSSGAWTIDGSSGKAMPSTGAEAAALLAAAGISASTLGLWLFGVPATGDIADVSGNGKTLAARAGNLAFVSYRQNVAGWAAKATVATGNQSGAFDNNTFPNINASTPTLIVYAELVAEGATRTVARYGTVFNDDCTFNQTNTPRIQGGEGDGTYTTGGSDPTGAVRPYVLSCGASVILSSDQETIAVGTKAANGTMLTFGGDNTDTNFPSIGKCVFGWLIDAALSSAQQRTLLQVANWTIPW